MGAHDALAALADNRDLSTDEATGAMQDVVNGTAPPGAIEQFAAALRAKGETVDELTAMAHVMRDATVTLEADGPALDTAGSGGDGTKSFNVSTVAAIVAAATGVTVAKQHDRAVTSRCGSTELLETLGVACDLPLDAAARCLRETGLCFPSVPRYHMAAFRHLTEAGPGTDTWSLLHLLSLLANPAHAEYQLVGVTDARRADAVAEVLRRLGSTHSLVVRGDDGMDEITCTRTTSVHEVVGEQ